MGFVDIWGLMGWCVCCARCAPVLRPGGGLLTSPGAVVALPALSVVSLLPTRSAYPPIVRKVEISLLDEGGEDGGGGDVQARGRLKMSTE